MVRSILGASALFGCTGTLGPTEAPPTSDTADPVPSCASLAPTGTVLDPDPAGPDTQIHAASAFDGSGVWVAYNLPDAQGGFDVWATRLGCDGEVSVAPVHVSASDDNELDPSVAVSHGRVLVAWQSDSGQTPDNLDLRWRVLDADPNAAGAALGEVQEWSEAGNHWMPSVAATDNGFVMAWAGAGPQVFEVFTVQLDVDGAPSGEVVDVPGDPGQGQVSPSVAVDPSGSVHVVWDGDTVGYAVDGVPTPWEVAGGAPSVAAGAAGVWAAWSASDGSVVLARPGEAPGVLKGGDPLQHSIAVSVGSTGGHALWSTNLSGLDNRLRIGRFDDGGALVDTLELAEGGVPPYATQVTPIDDDLVFVAWQVGASPAFRLEAAFVAL